jgi:hypothetical protein
MLKFRCAVLCVLIVLGGKAMAVDEPPFRVIEADGAFEVRDYPALVVAEVTVAGNQDEAGNRGFRLLAAYIFGGNTRKQSIAMTAPVVQNPDPGEKIAMTAPVVQSQQAGTPQAPTQLAGTDQPGTWTVRFIMPQGSTLESLPTPNDARVHLVAAPPTRVAVVRFSGLAFASDVVAKTAELRAWIASRHWSAIGPPQLARYNPPWTLWFLRRNEVMISLSTGGAS